MDQSLLRSMQARQNHLQQNGPAQPGDEDEDENIDEDEEEYRKNCLEMLGGVMEVQPDAFAQDQIMQGLQAKFQQWLQDPNNRVIGLYLACEVVDKLKQRSVPLWPAFMPMVFQ